MRIKKNDMVVILAGKDRGKSGLVLEIAPKKNKVKVHGIGVVSRHYRARKRGEGSQIKRMETFIDMSNVMLFDKNAQRPCRVAVQVVDGTKKRVSHLTKEIV